jgi:hypothetical protein
MAIQQKHEIDLSWKVFIVFIQSLNRTIRNEF